MKTTTQFLLFLRKFSTMLFLGFFFGFFFLILKVLFLAFGARAVSKRRRMLYRNTDHLRSCSNLASATPTCRIGSIAMNKPFMEIHDWAHSLVIDGIVCAIYNWMQIIHEVTWRTCKCGPFEFILQKIRRKE